MKNIPIDIAAYKVTSPIALSDYTTAQDFDTSDKKLEKALEHIRELLGEFQDTLYAHGKYGVLVCLQGMDTAGKDSLVREVFKDFNSRGIVVHSFKVPTDLEKKHDFLWRHYIALPAKGKFGVFNRTHYENVLVTRVHPEYILGENLPHVTKVSDVDDAFWEQRFSQIKNFENHIIDNGVLVFKFFLHLSKEEQRRRLLRRIEKKEKNWKFSPSDLKERKLWDNYQFCYQEAINNTATQKAPWYIIPADNKKAARYIVASILYKTLIAFKDIEKPVLSPEIMQNLAIYKEQLEKE